MAFALTSVHKQKHDMRMTHSLSLCLPNILYLGAAGFGPGSGAPTHERATRRKIGAGVVLEVGAVEKVLGGGRISLSLGLHNCVLTSWLRLAPVREGGPC